MRSNRLVLPPIRLVANATAISSVGKNARKRLKAIACEITLHRGNTRANIRYTFRKSFPAESMASHYTCDGHSLSEKYVRALRLIPTGGCDGEGLSPCRPARREIARGAFLPGRAARRGHRQIRSQARKLARRLFRSPTCTPSSAFPAGGSQTLRLRGHSPGGRCRPLQIEPFLHYTLCANSPSDWPGSRCPRNPDLLLSLSSTSLAAPDTTSE